MKSKGSVGQRQKISEFSLYKEQTDQLSQFMHANFRKISPFPNKDFSETISTKIDTTPKRINAAQLA